MTTKHTPGPWERVDTADYAEIHPICVRLKSPIALVGMASDADLIAAAPDITAALKLFVERIEANGEWDDGCFYYRGTSASELQEPLRLAHDAIAKAEGRSS